MSELDQLPPGRELPAPTADRIRARVLAGAAHPIPGRSRWLPLAAAAAVVALIAGAVTIAGRSPDAPPATPEPSPTPVAIPSLPEVYERCGVQPVYDHVTRYEGDGAVSWLFIEERSKGSAVCTWKVGSTGLIANFMNDWDRDGMAPAVDGKVHVTQDRMMPVFEDGATVPPEYAELEPDRSVLLGPVPAETTRVVVEGPDGPQVAALASSWFLYHFRKPGTYVVKAYDAAGTLVDEPVRMNGR